MREKVRAHRDGRVEIPTLPYTFPLEEPKRSSAPLLKVFTTRDGTHPIRVARSDERQDVQPTIRPRVLVILVPVRI